MAPVSKVKRQKDEGVQESKKEEGKIIKDSCDESARRHVFDDPIGTELH
jgi:hypothetical protein